MQFYREPTTTVRSGFSIGYKFFGIEYTCSTDPSKGCGRLLHQLSKYDTGHRKRQISRLLKPLGSVVTEDFRDRCLAVYPDTVKAKVAYMDDVSWGKKVTFIATMDSDMILCSYKRKMLIDYTRRMLDEIENGLEKIHVPDADPFGEAVKMALLSDLESARQVMTSTLEWSEASSSWNTRFTTPKSCAVLRGSCLETLLHGSDWEACTDVSSFERACFLVSETNMKRREMVGILHRQTLLAKGRDERGRLRIQFGDFVPD